MVTGDLSAEENQIFIDAYAFETTTLAAINREFMQAGHASPRGDDMLWKFGLRKEESSLERVRNNIFSYFFATGKSGTMDSKVL